MTAGQRVMINAIATYGRTVLGIALGLFSGRWVLLSLGQVDYGLLGVVGGLFGFIVMFNTVSATSCSRYFALSVGNGDLAETNRWFNVAVFIHLIIPIGLVFVGLPLGEWAIDNLLTIPETRVHTAHLVFRISVASSFVAMVSAPYMGMMVAKQNITEMSLWHILGNLLRFVAIYAMLHYTGDAWLFYVAATSAISVVILIAQAYRCYHLYRECALHASRMIDFKRICSLFRFAGWQMLAAISGVCRGIGMGVLINQYFPPQKEPSANASFTIGQNISSYSGILSSALLSAFLPEITATEGRGDRERMFSHATKASKFGTFLVVLVAIPLMIEVRPVLDLWLKTPPDFAWVFALYMIGQVLVENLTYGQMAAVNAVGRIGFYQCVVSGLTMCALPVAWILYVCGFGVGAAGLAILITYAFAMLARVILARFIIGYAVAPWFRQVFVPAIIVMGVAFGVGVLLKSFIKEAALFQIIAVSIVTDSCILVLSWGVLFNREERSFVGRQFECICRRVLKQTGGGQ